jgi:ribonuclease P/MRP protein subunit RPP40
MQTSGIAQGSVLGPLCFLLFINDIVDNVRHCSVKLYADDVKIYFKFAPINWYGALQIDLDSIARWANTWQLSISVQKSYLLHFGLHNPCHNYFINGALIATVQSVKDLGVLVAVNLSWHEHVLYVAKKANRVANCILHAFKCRNVEVYMRAFDAYVRPIIEFCNCVWQPHAVILIPLKMYREFLLGVYLNDVCCQEWNIVIDWLCCIDIVWNVGDLLTVCYVLLYF